ncbi:isocitrate lyase/PEP mutase family protein [Sediminispirochaeta smaragdinae]|jgi:2-methylisocitrate lyase-like PEP mutase family enzyme|uniref:Lyase/mutase n=1 Tax=Sediminispirochaeta smaragdinae (strain DSM 11293 / JCM 15392 / SEBR 4228) TaxID=573413 RepID=E1RCP6_SEDSS|nr:isocitrate lyase/PEP mutase family protein [Sediminispirochaeta smaragdinae]ADK80126.1 putative lyase/mutase [Sediminispirochaeta smaragdinae DSM 11293]
MGKYEKQPVKSFKDLVVNEQIFAPCVWDCRSARAAELSGFKALMLSGGQLAESVAGLPDIGLITADDVVQSTERICNYSSLPLIVDADDGFGDTPLTTYRLIKRLINAGAKGCTLDDTTGIRGWNRWGFAMMNGYKDGDIKHEVVSKEKWLAKIAASLEAAKEADFLVIARTECKLQYGLDEAISRCKAAEAMAEEMGVDIMTLIIGLKTIEEAKVVNEEVKGWKMWPDVMSKNGKPDVDLRDVEPYGFNFVTCHFLEKASMFGMYDYGKHVVVDRNTVYADDHDMGGMPAEDMPKWVDMGLNYWIGIEEEFNDTAKKFTN